MGDEARQQSQNSEGPGLTSRESEDNFLLRVVGGGAPSLGHASSFSSSSSSSGSTAGRRPSESEGPLTSGESESLGSSSCDEWKGEGEEEEDGATCRGRSWSQQGVGSGWVSLSEPLNRPVSENWSGPALDTKESSCRESWLLSCRQPRLLTDNRQTAN